MLYWNFGYLLLLSEQYTDGETTIKRAISIRPDHWISHLNLALVYEAIGRYDNAEEQYKLVCCPVSSLQFFFGDWCFSSSVTPDRSTGL